MVQAALERTSRKSAVGLTRIHAVHLPLVAGTDMNRLQPFDGRSSPTVMTIGVQIEATDGTIGFVPLKELIRASVDSVVLYRRDNHLQSREHHRHDDPRHLDKPPSATVNVANLRWDRLLHQDRLKRPNVEGVTGVKTLSSQI